MAQFQPPPSLVGGGGSIARTRRGVISQMGSFLFRFESAPGISDIMLQVSPNVFPFVFAANATNFSLVRLQIYHLQIGMHNLLVYYFTHSGLSNMPGILKLPYSILPF